jgi:hypothetical protein
MIALPDFYLELMFGELPDTPSHERVVDDAASALGELVP